MVAELARLAGVPVAALSELLERHWAPGDAAAAQARLRDLRFHHLADGFTAAERIRLLVGELRSLGLPVKAAVIEVAERLGLAPSYVRASLYRGPRKGAKSAP